MTNNTTNPTEIINNLDSTITNAPQGSTINLNFNTYENYYNTFNRESFVTDDTSNKVIHRLIYLQKLKYLI